MSGDDARRKPSLLRSFMRITAVEPVRLRERGVDAENPEHLDLLLVRVHTDEGIVGVGEVDSMPSVIESIIDAPALHSVGSGLRALLVGQDASDIDGLWQAMYRGSLWYGRRGAALHAISAVDVALWDIRGQATGRPVYELLGGLRTDGIRAYASLTMPDTVTEVVEAVERSREAGFGAVKLGWGPLGRDPDLDVELVAAARKAAGGEADLMLDMGKSWTDARDAVGWVRRLEQYQPYWIEEPLMPDDYAGYEYLAARVDVPLAAGEEESTIWDFERVLGRSGIDIVQPDVARVGGLTQAVQVMALARERGRRVVPHVWSTGISRVATAHLLAATHGAELLEYWPVRSVLDQTVVRDPLELEDGFVRVPPTPGLGIVLDEERLAHVRVR